METLTSVLALIAGLLIRLAIPITLTAVLIFLLRKLDARWQAEVKHEPLLIQKPECWKIKGCSPVLIKHCAATSSPLPCWQVFRQPNGYLREECLTCKVFVEAPMPTLQIEPRRL